MVKDLVKNLCESLVENIDGVAGVSKKTPAPPTPIIYLTQWKMMGNSVVHTDEYLTQWKVEGNSVVDNNAILSCGDYSDVDGKYHVKISNGVTIYDIPLTEPLRKVNDIADSIEFVNGVATVTRNIASVDMGSINYTYRDDFANPVFQVGINDRAVGRTNVLSSLYVVSSASTPADLGNMETLGHWSVALVYFRNDTYTNVTEFKNAMRGVELIYELAIPTTETIQVSPFPVSATDTYTSANDTPYSAFEYKKNVEIWSCGEYSAVDGKYHILVQPLGGSIADIALDEPLRKVNDVADSIEFVDGVATVTRNFASVDISTYRYVADTTRNNKYRFVAYEQPLPNVKRPATTSATIHMLCALYNTVTALNIYVEITGISLSTTGIIGIYDENYNESTSKDALMAHIQGAELLYELATPTTETIQVPQIEEAESYSCIISQGGKAVEWSSFETE